MGQRRCSNPATCCSTSPISESQLLRGARLPPASRPCRNVSRPQNANWQSCLDWSRCIRTRWQHDAAGPSVRCWASCQDSRKPVCWNRLLVECSGELPETNRRHVRTDCGAYLAHLVGVARQAGQCPRIDPESVIGGLQQPETAVPVDRYVQALCSRSPKRHVLLGCIRAAGYGQADTGFGGRHCHRLSRLALQRAVVDAERYRVGLCRGIGVARVDGRRAGTISEAPGAPGYLPIGIVTPIGKSAAERRAGESKPRGRRQGRARAYGNRTADGIGGSVIVRRRQCYRVGSGRAEGVRWAALSRHVSRAKVPASAGNLAILIGTGVAERAGYSRSAARRLESCLRSTIPLGHYHVAGHSPSAIVIVGHLEGDAEGASALEAVTGILFGRRALVAKVPAPAHDASVAVATAILELTCHTRRAFGRGIRGFGQGVGLAHHYGSRSKSGCAVIISNLEGDVVAARLQIGVHRVLIGRGALVAEVPTPADNLPITVVAGVLEPTGNAGNAAGRIEC